MTIKVAVYFRCSTDKQDKSIGDQRRVLVEYAAKKEMQITTWFDKDEGLSGTSFEKRPDFMRMVRMVESGQNDFKKVLVYDVDRWGRPIDPDEASYWEFHLKRFGVHVIYVSDESVNDNTLAGRLTKKIKQELATEESRKQSLRVRERSKMRAAEGFRVGGFAPYGYKRLLVDPFGLPIRVLEAGEPKGVKTYRVRLIPGDPAQIETVQMIFRAKAEGKSTKSIAKVLNTKGIPTPSASAPGYKLASRTYWLPNSVYNILTNPVYRGDIIYNRQARGSWVKVEDPQTYLRDKDQWVIAISAHEGIVDAGLYDAAHRQLKIELSGRPRQFRMESPYYLSGLVECSICAGKFHGHVHRTSTGTAHQYYESKCSDKIWNSPCGRGMIPKKEIEEFILAQLVDRIMTRIDYDKLRTRIRERLVRPETVFQKELDGLNKALNENAVRTANLVGSIENGVDPEVVAPRIAVLKEKQRQMLHRKEELDHSVRLSENADGIIDCVIAQINDLHDILRKASPITLRKIMPNLVHRIVVDSKQREVKCEFFKLPQVKALEICDVGYNYAGGRVCSSTDTMSSRFKLLVTNGLVL